MAAVGKTSGIDPGLVRELAQILRDTDLTEIEVEHADLKLRISRGATAVHYTSPPGFHAPAPVGAPAMAIAASPPMAAGVVEAPPGAASDKGGKGAIPSPMVGTVYLSPEPEAAPFCKVGDNVSEGQTLLIVEAMKTMNPIPSPKTGKVLEICVQDGQPVEFGQALIVIG